MSHVLISGGSSGIGLALLRLLAAQSWTISVLARDSNKLAQARAELLALGASAVHVQVVDVSIQGDVEHAVEECVAQNGRIDWLIANAGMARPGYFQQLDTEVFTQTMAVNYFGSLWLIRAGLVHLNHDARIGIVSSGAALVGVFGYSAYAPTKFALRGLAETLRAELGPKGIHVSVVYPPDTQTPQLEDENRYKPEETRRITASGGLWSAEGVAQSIVLGMQRKRFEITPGLEMRLLNRLHSVLNPLLRRYFDRLAKSDS